MAEPVIQSAPAAPCARLLGPAWPALDEVVRRLHGGGRRREAKGRFTVLHGRSPGASLLLRLWRLPPAGKNVPMRLVITREGESERWERTFGACRLVSTQAARGGLLGERFGLLELRFALRSVRGALVFRQASAALRLGPLRLALPRWASPRVVARASAGALPGDVRARVKVRAPLVGPLLAYAGVIRPQQEGAS